MDLTPKQIEWVEYYINKPEKFNAILSQADNLKQVASYFELVQKYSGNLYFDEPNASDVTKMYDVTRMYLALERYYEAGREDWKAKITPDTKKLISELGELEKYSNDWLIKRDEIQEAMHSHSYHGNYLDILKEVDNDCTSDLKIFDMDSEFITKLLSDNSTQTDPPVDSSEFIKLESTELEPTGESGPAIELQSPTVDSSEIGGSSPVENVKKSPTLEVTPDSLIERTYQERAKAVGQDVKAFIDDLQRTVPLDTDAETIKKKFDGMKEAVDAIDNAIRDNQKIFIYGDYDVDGITSATITENSIKRRAQALKREESNISFKDDNIIVHLPQRSEGYGINEQSLKSLTSQIPEGQKALMITVDTGTGAWDKLDKFADKFNYVVTDHHLPENGETVKSVMKNRSHIKTILNPHYTGTYGFEHLSGAGVAFKLSQALGGGEADADLAALGTIADMVPLQGENRAIVQSGLKMMNDEEQGNKGIQAIWQAMQPKNPSITSEGVAYYIAPAINAAGRIGEEYDKKITDSRKKGVYLPYDILSGKVPPEKAAQHLVDINKDRREQTDEAVKYIEEKLKEELGDDVKDISQGLKAAKKKSIVVHKEGLPHGLIGLVAGKLQERYHVPTIVFSGEEGDIRGSARSVEGLNLKDTLDRIAAVSDGPLKPGAYGGHEGAAGLSVAEGKIKDFADAFDKKVQQVLGDDYVPKPSVDLRLSDGTNLSSLFTLDNVEKLEKMAPFGQGTPRPTYQSRVQIGDINHLKNNVMTFNVFSQGDKKQGLPAIIFDSTHLGNKISINQAYYKGYVDITFQAGVKTEERGKKSVQLTVTDIGFLEGEAANVKKEDRILPFDKIEKAKVDPEVQEQVSNILKNAPDFSKPLDKNVLVAEAAKRLADTVQEKDFRDKTLQPLVEAYEQEYLDTAGDKALDSAEKLEELISDSDKIYGNIQSLVDRYLSLDDKSSTEAKEMLKNIRGYLNSVGGPKQGIYFSDDIVELFKQYSEETILQLEETEDTTPEKIKERKVQALFADQVYEIVKQRKFTPSKSKNYKALGEKIEEYYGKAFDQLKRNMESEGLTYDREPEQQKEEELNRNRPKGKSRVPVRKSWRYNQIRGQVQNWAIDHAEGLQEEIAALQAFANYYGIPEEDTKPPFETKKPSSIRKSLREAIVRRVEEDYKGEIAAIHAIEGNFGSNEDILRAVYKSPRDLGQYFEKKLAEVTETKDILTKLYGETEEDIQGITGQSLKEYLNELREDRSDLFTKMTEDFKTFEESFKEDSMEGDLWNYHIRHYKDKTGKEVLFTTTQEYKDFLGDYIDYLLENKQTSLSRSDFQWLIDGNFPAKQYSDRIDKKITEVTEKSKIKEHLEQLSWEEFQEDIKDKENRKAWGTQEVTKNGKKYFEPVDTYYYDGMYYRTKIQEDMDILAEESKYIQEHLRRNNVVFDITGIEKPHKQLEYFKGILAAESSKAGSNVAKSLTTAAELGQRYGALTIKSNEEFQKLLLYEPGWQEKYFEIDIETKKIKTDTDGKWVRKKAEDVANTSKEAEEIYKNIENIRKNRKAWGTIEVKSADGKRQFTRLRDVAYFGNKIYRIPKDKPLLENDVIKAWDGEIKDQIEYLNTQRATKDLVEQLKKKYPKLYSEEKGFNLSYFSEDNISNQKLADRINMLNDFYHDVTYHYERVSGYETKAKSLADYLDTLTEKEFDEAYQSGISITSADGTVTEYDNKQVHRLYNRARGTRDLETGYWHGGVIKVNGQYYRSDKAPAGVVRRSNEKVVSRQQQPKAPETKAAKTVENVVEVLQAGGKLAGAVVDEGKQIVESTENILVDIGSKALGLDKDAAQTAENVAKTKVKTKMPNARKFAFGSHMPTMLGFMGTMGAITLFDSAFHSRGEDEYERYQRQRAEQRRSMYSGEFYG